MQTRETDRYRAIPASSVRVSGERNEVVFLGDERCPTCELKRASSGKVCNKSVPKQTFQFGNPGPLGLCAFAITTFISSMITAQVLNLQNPSIVIGPACFYGGAAQFIAGIWEFFLGNTFGLLVMTLYGSFWLSYAAIFIDAFGIAAAYEGDEDQYHTGIAFFSLAWLLFSLMLLILTLKSTAAVVALFVSINLTLILLTVGSFLRSTGVSRASGISGMISSAIALYNAWTGLATPQNSYWAVTPKHN